MKRCAVALTVLGFASLLQAEVVNVSQTRMVRASTGWTPAQTRSTTGTGGWIQQIEVNDLPSFESRGIASQNSIASTTRFAATGTAYAQDDSFSSSGGASTSFQAVFGVSADTPYTFVGSWSTSHGNYGLTPVCSMKFERLSPQPLVLHSSAYFNNYAGTIVWSGSADLAGILTPGQYRLSTSVAIDAYQNPGYLNGTAQFSFDLLVPSPSLLPAIAIAGLATRRRR